VYSLKYPGAGATKIADSLTGEIEFSILEAAAMQVGNLIQFANEQWSVTRIDGKGNPLEIQAIGRIRRYHRGSVLGEIGAIVSRKSFDSQSNITRLELATSVPPPTLLHAPVVWNEFRRRSAGNGQRSNARGGSE